MAKTTPRSRNDQAPFGIVLAAGDGTRLAPLVRRLHGDDRPKQFARLCGEVSMLEATLDRMAGLVDRAKTVVVAGAHHEFWAEAQLSPRRGLDLVLQPANRGTAPGILLPLARVLARDPDAAVVITPSDHHFARPARFARAIATALDTANETPSGVCLVAVEAEAPACDLGWIVPVDDGSARLVASFVEKPEPATATTLHRQRALWNTFVMVGAAQAFWRLVEARRPTITQRFARYRDAVGGPREVTVLEEIYRDLPHADFSRDVLAHSRGLGVVAAAGAGWSDWGTPDRVLATLAGSPHSRALAAHLRGAAPGRTLTFDKDRNRLAPGA